MTSVIRVKTDACNDRCFIYCFYLMDAGKIPHQDYKADVLKGSLVSEYAPCEWKGGLS